MSALTEAIARGKARLTEMRQREAKKKQLEIEQHNAVLDRRWEKVLAGVQALLGPLQNFLESLPRPSGFSEIILRQEVPLQFPSCAPIYVTMQASEEAAPWQPLPIYARGTALYEVPGLDRSPVTGEPVLQRRITGVAFCTNSLDEALAEAHDRQQQMEVEAKKRQAEVQAAQVPAEETVAEEKSLGEQLVSLIQEVAFNTPLNPVKPRRSKKTESKP